MSRFIAKQAQRRKLKARIGLTGATNTGKTYTALRIAAGLLLSEGIVDNEGNPDWSKVAVLDTERSRALFYANDGVIGSFLHVPFEPPYSPLAYIEAVQYIESLGVEVCIIDSLSHAWNGTGGVLDIVAERTEKSKNAYTAGWGGKDGGTALQNKMIDVIMSCNMHTICTFRQKMEYAVEKDEDNKTVIRKLGVKPVQRDDLEYEFDITLKLDNDHTAEILKNTVRFLGGNEDRLPMITEEFGRMLGSYLNTGLDMAEYEKAYKEQYTAKIKEYGEQHEELYEYFVNMYPNRALDSLSIQELKELLDEFERMLAK